MCHRRFVDAEMMAAFALAICSSIKTSDEIVVTVNGLCKFYQAQGCFESRVAVYHRAYRLPIIR